MSGGGIALCQPSRAPTARRAAISRPPPLCRPPPAPLVLAVSHSELAVPPLPPLFLHRFSWFFFYSYVVKAFKYDGSMCASAPMPPPCPPAHLPARPALLPFEEGDVSVPPPRGTARHGTRRCRRRNGGTRAKQLPESWQNEARGPRPAPPASRRPPPASRLPPPAPPSRPQSAPLPVPKERARETRGGMDGQTDGRMGGREDGRRDREGRGRSPEFRLYESRARATMRHTTARHTTHRHFFDTSSFLPTHSTLIFYSTFHPHCIMYVGDVGGRRRESRAGSRPGPPGSTA